MNRLLFFILFAFSAIPAAAIEATDGQQWYGYYSGSEQLSEFGTGQSEHYMCAIYLPGNQGQAYGKTIRALRFIVQGVADLSDMDVWLSTSLPGTMDDVDIFSRRVDLSAVSDLTPCDVALDVPYAVPGGGVYVGYSFWSDDPFPVIATTGVPTLKNSFFLKTSDSYPTWQDMTRFNYGNLALQVLLDGEFHDNAAKVANFGEQVTTAGASTTLPLTIVNWGSKGMSSIDFVLTDDGVAQPEQHYDFAEPVTVVRGTATIELPFTSPAETGISHKTVTITRVNGVTNEYNAQEASAHGAVITISESAPRRVVMEEFTGTWCGWCPRGLVGLEHLEKDFGDRFIGISVHNNDPMVIPDYDPLLPRSFPSENLDRQESGDPFFGFFYGLGSEPSYGIRADVERHLAELTEATIELKADWTDKDSTGIHATASITLQYDRDDTPPYALAYVLLADSLRGEGNNWNQNNDFTLVMAQGYASDPYLGYLTQLDQRIKGLSYNDVAVATAGLRRGLSGSVTGPFVRGVPNMSEHTLDISTNTIIQNKRNLRLVVLLLNTDDGHIVNAADTRIGGSSTDDITTVNSKTVGGEQHFDLTGRPTGYSYHGRSALHIVRQADGTAKKIIVKQ